MYVSGLEYEYSIPPGMACAPGILWMDLWFNFYLFLNDSPLGRARRISLIIKSNLLKITLLLKENLKIRIT